MRGQLRVSAVDLQCGVAVETVDSQNPSSYTDYTRLCVHMHVPVCVCVCAVRSVSLRGCIRVCVRARIHVCVETARREGCRAQRECGYTHVSNTLTASFAGFTAASSHESPAECILRYHSRPA